MGHQEKAWSSSRWLKGNCLASYGKGQHQTWSMLEESGQHQRSSLQECDLNGGYKHPQGGDESKPKTRAVNSVLLFPNLVDPNVMNTSKRAERHRPKA
mmetsp:Transcript_12907/g.27401  ORF Transcript_12907/g.27401 Transcript_12907/m.27401 type:complete len:98 (+) Transcript_12907:344-637(+)